MTTKQRGDSRLTDRSADLEARIEQHWLDRHDASDDAEDCSRAEPLMPEFGAESEGPTVEQPAAAPPKIRRSVRKWRWL